MEPESIDPAATVHPGASSLPLGAAEILESVGDAFYAVDAGWRLVYVNRRAEELWGIPAEQLLGRDLWDAFPHSVGQPIQRELLRAAGERAERHVELFSEVMDRWIEVSVYPLAGGDRTGGGGLGVYFRDITGRKRLEEEWYWLLREAQSRAAELGATLESLPDPLFIGNKALVTLANAPALRLFGCISIGELNAAIRAGAGRVFATPPRGGTSRRRTGRAERGGRRCGGGSGRGGGV